MEVRKSETAGKEDKYVIMILLMVRVSSLPSQYLYPLAAQLHDHPVIFYDQLGCGKSDEPKDLSL
jgi:proline iminopeptidase